MTSWVVAPFLHHDDKSSLSLWCASNDGPALKSRWVKVVNIGPRSCEQMLSGRASDDHILVIIIQPKKKAENLTNEKLDLMTLYEGLQWQFKLYPYCRTICPLPDTLIKSLSFFLIGLVEMSKVTWNIFFAKFRFLRVERCSLWISKQLAVKV